MAPFLLWTAALAALVGLGSVSAMPMLTEGETRLGVPSSVLEWYVQQRGDLQRDAQADREARELALEQMLQKEEFARQFKQWLDSQLARLQSLQGLAPAGPAAPDVGDEPGKALAPQPPAKRGNYMALCHFKICNMGRKRSPRLQPQELP